MSHTNASVGAGNSMSACDSAAHPHLFAVSDLHVQHAANADVTAQLRPRHPADWLIVAGDVAEMSALVIATLAGLAARFSRVVWTPGNHELWTHPQDPDTRRGLARYHHLVAQCRRLGVITPEDPFERWESPTGPLAVAPAFLLYDYSFRPPGLSLEKALLQAEEAGIVFTDEYLLHPDPFPDRSAWCHDRIETTEIRLNEVPQGMPIVLASHYPIIELPTQRMFSPHLALWCGSRGTAGWPARYALHTSVYGHLHMPGSTRIDGVAYEEVSFGYPREQKYRRTPFEPRVIACGIEPAA